MELETDAVDDRSCAKCGFKYQVFDWSPQWRISGFCSAHCRDFYKEFIDSGKELQSLKKEPVFEEVNGDGVGPTYCSKYLLDALNSFNSVISSIDLFEKHGEIDKYNEGHKSMNKLLTSLESIKTKMGWEEEDA